MVMQFDSNHSFDKSPILYSLLTLKLGLCVTQVFAFLPLFLHVNLDRFIVSCCLSSICACIYMWGVCLISAQQVWVCFKGTLVEMEKKKKKNLWPTLISNRQSIATNQAAK